MHGFPRVSFVITGTEAMSGEIRKGLLGGVAAPSLLLMPSSRLGCVVLRREPGSAVYETSFTLPKVARLRGVDVIL